jgi:lysophospholipase L1-like esterase
VRHSRLGTAVLAAALLLSGCTPSDAGAPEPSSAPGAPGPSAPPEVQRYVALGDSFSAGPLIPTSDLAGGCLRSDRNYPSLVAEDLDVADFVDVTCSAATTRDVTRAQPTFGGARIPPQLRSVTVGTDLVTIGIGGNDLGLFGTLVQTCTGLRASDPSGSPCARRLAERGPDLAAATRVISARVARALRAIRSKAPQATVLLVGYLRLVPDRGSCRRLPLARGDYAEGRRISRVLDRSLARAARLADVGFVDMYDASRGHDICADEPWVNGSNTDRDRALAYHPFAAGMRAYADEVLRALGRSRPAPGGP